MKESWHKRSVTVTLVLVYLVILAGGVVRCTGSGMGCPDWPRCFGRWIPPTQISELPKNYVTIYSKKGHYTAEFNVYKTWTEYVNRLLGALVGISVFCVFIFSIVYIKKRNEIVIWSFLSFILVGAQGWLGAKVVFSNLKPFMITIHMLLALVIVDILIYISMLIHISKVEYDKRVMTFGLIGFIVSILQIISGTQVRQMVDVVSVGFGYQHRELWVDQLGCIFVVHRLLAYVVVGVNLSLAWFLHLSHDKVIRNCIIVILMGEVGSGLVMTYLNIPSYIQPLHLFLAAVLSGVQFYLVVRRMRGMSYAMDIKT